MQNLTPKAPHTSLTLKAINNSINSIWKDSEIEELKKLKESLPENNIQKPKSESPKMKLTPVEYRAVITFSTENEKDFREYTLRSNTKAGLEIRVIDFVDEHKKENETTDIKTFAVNKYPA